MESQSENQPTLTEVHTALHQEILDEPGLEEFVNLDVIDSEAEEILLDEDEGAARRALNNRERALKAALAQLGYQEEPPGSNGNKFSQYFHKGRQPWCADFVSWAFDSTGNGDRRVPWGNPSAVAAIVTWAKRRGFTVNHPAPGDIFTQQGSSSHCGIVRRVEGNLVLCVEGNTTRQGHRGCIWVAHHRRPISYPGRLFVRVPTNPW